MLLWIIKKLEEHWIYILKSRHSTHNSYSDWIANQFALKFLPEITLSSSKNFK
jgi:hypothetical protein